jgi:hypothetical protein
MGAIPGELGRRDASPEDAGARPAPNADHEPALTLVPDRVGVRRVGPGTIEGQNERVAALFHGSGRKRGTLTPRIEHAGGAAPHRYDAWRSATLKRIYRY